MTGVGQVLRSPFDRPARWRAEVVEELGLRGDERCAAASPAPGFPTLLESVVDEVGLRPGRWIDVGGGLGGAAGWVARRTDGAVRPIVIDPVSGSLEAARRLFPSLCVALGDGEQLPVRSGSVDGAFVNGVLSLHRQVRPMLAELRRCLGEAGRAAFTDIWSNEAGTFDDGPNRFWSLADIATELAEADLRVVHVVAAELSAGWWSQVAVDVDAEIDRRFAGRRGYDEWRADGDHLRRVAGSGRLMAAGLVVAVGRASGRSGQPSRS